MICDWRLAGWPVPAIPSVPVRHFCDARQAGDWRRRTVSIYQSIRCQECPSFPAAEKQWGSLPEARNGLAIAERAAALSARARLELEPDGGTGVAVPPGSVRRTSRSQETPGQRSHSRKSTCKVSPATGESLPDIHFSRWLAPPAIHNIAVCPRPAVPAPPEPEAWVNGAGERCQTGLTLSSPFATFGSLLLLLGRACYSGALIK